MFEKDVFHGDGTYFYANGDVYSGAWVKGVKQGEGNFVYAKDKSQIVGTWLKNGCVSGRWIWADGTLWVGPFKDGRPLGRGVFYFARTKQEGEYVLEPSSSDEDAPLRLVWRGGAVDETDGQELALAPRVLVSSVRVA